MTNVDKILNVLENQKLTSSQISELTGIENNSLYVVLNELTQRNLIMRVNESKPYKYRNSTKKVLLKGLYDIMVNKMKAVEKLNKHEITMIKMIDEVLNK